MNMKKLIISIIAVAAFVFAGCDHLLEQQPKDQFSDSNFWTSENNVEIFANSFYNEFTGFSGDFYFPTLNDNQASNGFTEWTYKTVPSSISLWNSCYTYLRRANLMIERIPNITAMTDDQKNNWIGFARLFRAYEHYQLVRAFGDIIYVDKVLDVSDEDKENYLYGDREDRDEVMDKVLEDLNFAVENITNDSDSRVAVNAAVAQAIKAEICLYEGTFCKYRSASDGQKAPDETRAAEYLTEAKNACLAIMDNSMYALNSSYRENYNSLDLTGNEEMILYKKYVYGTLAHSTIDYTCSSTMQSGMTKSAFDSYLFIDGKPLATTSENTTDHPVMNSDGDLDISDLLAVRDPRLAASIDPVLMYKGNGYVRFGVGMETTSSTGYGVLKFDNSEIEVSHRNNTGSNETDSPIYWLAEIYLNYAEACAELGSITQTDLDISINLLRDRVGMPHLTVSPEADPANNMGVSNIIWEIRRERRVELMYDVNDRYWCLIRWHQLDKLDVGDYPDQVRGAYVADDSIAGTDDGPTIDSEGYIYALPDGKDRSYDPKYYLYPIPSGQITLYEVEGKTLTQNYGWD
jgi:hypothetical protein